MRNRHSGSQVGLALLIVLFFGLSLLGSWGCREYQVNKCEGRGGQAITHPWYSGDAYIAVGCIEPSGR